MTITQEEVETQLRRLHRYYSGRARASRRLAEKSIDCQDMAERANAGAQWEARVEAIIRVAECLGIELPATKQEGTSE